MATTDLTADDRERFARARAHGKATSQDASAVVDACYVSDRDAVEIRFRGGGAMVIPRRVIPGLKKAPKPVLEAIDISPAGDALSWRSLDVDVSVPGLVEKAFGARLFATTTGRRGGQQKSAAKAVAARANGAKGGRPRSPVGA